MVGETFGTYRIVRKLGEGGMGAVFLGEHARLDRRVAIKLLRAELSGDQEVLNRFFTEARATSLIHHPNIVEIFDCDIDPRGRAFIMMEFLDGETLAALLERQGSLAGDLGSVMAIAIQTTNALAAAHAKGIIHRDLKPENILLTTDSDGKLRVKVVDFGIAKLVGDAGAGLAHQTRTGSMMGTPLYMAPEQARGASRVDARSDIYSFGCILFAMLAGTPPFVRDGVGDLVVAHITEPAPEIAGRVPGLPPRIAALVMTCLAKDPVARPQEMRAVEQELREITRTIGAAGAFAPVPEQTHPPRSPSIAPATPAPGSASNAPDARPASGASPDRRAYTTFDSGRGQVGEEADVPATPGHRWVKIAVPAAVVVGAAILFGLNRSGRDRDAAPATLQTPTVPSHPAPPPAAQREEKLATIQLRGLPPGAVVLLDGEPAHLPLKLPRGDRAYAVLARAAGYGDAKLTVRPTADQELPIAMQPLPASAKAEANRGEAERPEATKAKTKNKRAGTSKHRSGDFRGFNDL